MKSPAQFSEPPQCEEIAPEASPRAFGFVFTIFFLLVGLGPLLRGHHFRAWALMVAGFFFVCAVAAPKLLTLPNKLWLRLGLVMHRITQPLIMALLFFAVITPIGCLMRLLKREDSLRRKWNPDAPSYWILREPPGPTPDSMKHLF
jgi:hypothetical protein